MKNMIIKYTRDTMSQIYLDALHIRNEVFVHEQNVPLELEIDEYEALTLHFVLYEDNKALATLRLLPLEDGQIKLQRMAVIKEARQKHLGQELMTFAENFCKEQQFTTITLGGQESAIPFYQKLGYHVEGERFMDAGIPHFTLTKQL